MSFATVLISCNFAGCQMKILQLANKLPYPPKDGGAIGILNFTKGFSKHGVDVTILAMNTAKHYFNIKHLPEDINKIATFISVDIYAKPSVFGALNNFLFSSLPYTASRFISSKYQDELIKLLQKDVFDVIQLEGIYMAPYINTIRKYSNAIISLRAHNIEHEIWKRISKNSFFPKNIYFNNLTKRVRKFEKKFISKVDVVLPISERDKLQLVEMGLNTKDIIIPAGLNIEEYDLINESIQFPTLFHLGALDWEPNIEGLNWFLDHIWPELLEKTPNLKLYIAGRKASENVKNNLKRKNVVFDGEVDDAHSYMESKAIMIVPLLSGGGMRIKILEGMALGKTIVSTAIGAEGITCKHNHDILIANTSDDFIIEIEKLIKDRKKFDEIGSNARHFISENYDNFALVKRLLNFYKQLK